VGSVCVREREREREIERVSVCVCVSVVFWGRWIRRKTIQINYNIREI